MLCPLAAKGQALLGWGEVIGEAALEQECCMKCGEVICLSEA